MPDETGSSGNEEFSTQTIQVRNVYYFNFICITLQEMIVSTPARVLAWYATGTGI